MRNYVVVTPANNEDPYIEKTIEAVVSQSLRPVKWVIVDDGSTDRTVQIVNEYLRKYDFIRLVKLRRAAGRSFKRKVAAFNAGLELLKGTEYSFIGNLDADVSFAPDYYENIIAEFKKDPKLGIAGGIVYTKIGQKFVTHDTALDSVGGAVQLFRKECYDQVGGYLPLECGGVDAAAEIMARMKGWTVRKFPGNRVWEHRRTGSAGKGILAAKYNEGVRFHALGYSTVFYILRTVYKLQVRPFLIGSTLALLGFIYAKMRRYPVHLPPQAVSYLRSEQMGKIRNRLFGRVDKTLSLCRPAG